MTLIERLSKATGPDRELDCLIWAEIDGRDVYWDGAKLLARSRRAPHDVCWLGAIDKHARNFSETLGFKPPIPHYTKSIDAALMLVPYGYSAQVRHTPPEVKITRIRQTRGMATVWRGDAIGDPDTARTMRAAEAASAAIALCIVALQAAELSDGESDRHD